MESNFGEERAFFYSPYGFFKPNISLAREWLAEIKLSISNDKMKVFGESSGINIIYRRLDWDSEFFGIPFFKIEFTEFTQPNDYSIIQNAFFNFKNYIASQFDEYYIFAEVPSEDIGVIAGLTGSGWRLIETRITCYRDDLQSFSFPKRYGVRNATEDDIEELRKTAVTAVNKYDRFHADDFFLKKEADDFLGVFIENSVKGFADEVIVPAEGPPNAFLTCNYLKTPSSLSMGKIAKMVLSAVSEERKGWYSKLITELSFKLKEKGYDIVFMTTQSTNRVVLKVWYRHGYQFGKCSHIFSTYRRKNRIVFG